MSSEAALIVQRGLFGGLLAALRERRPAILCLGELPRPDFGAAARALGARTATSLHAAVSRPQFDVLVVAPGTVASAERPKMERALALARQWGVPTLIDATGAGTRASRTTAVRKAMEETLWPVIKADETEAAALASSAQPRSSKPPQRNSRKLAVSVVSGGGVAIVVGEQTVITDGSRSLTVHRATIRFPGEDVVTTAVLGASLTVADLADFVTVATMGVELLALAAERAARGASKPRFIKAQVLRELAAITAEDLHRKTQPAAR